MDRLICGDVGFGKTEVALRAAFAAVIQGFQVAILAPTTLLAQQHHRLFSDRFADWPVRVEMLTRFGGNRKNEELRDCLKDGRVDIVVGSHGLLSHRVRFKRLGLLIVDEEHRFGVRQKERIKALRADLHVLTLTATPIPRTLNMSLGGLRDLSLITTPPPARMAVKTFVTPWRNSLIREACGRELRRGGAVFFVHNRVQDIDRIARELQTLLGDVRLEVAHGKLLDAELQRVMTDFYHRRFDVLVCTTIIESGLDIPHANTMLINRADRLGLAQLHQLRGRVGRSHHQAYAYLIRPHEKEMTADAHKRLDAIQAAGELGAGFLLATHDLEIRGAGELLGEEQSGQIQQIGFSLYNEMLSQAVEELRGESTGQAARPAHPRADIELNLGALLPEDYMPDVNQRLSWYKRIASRVRFLRPERAQGRIGRSLRPRARGGPQPVPPGSHPATHEGLANPDAASRRARGRGGIQPGHLCGSAAPRRNRPATAGGVRAAARRRFEVSRGPGGARAPIPLRGAPSHHAGTVCATGRGRTLAACFRAYCAV